MVMYFAETKAIRLFQSKTSTIYYKQTGRIVVSTEMQLHLPSGVTEVNNVQYRIIGLSQTQTKINTSSYSVSVSAFLSCATNEALTDSPKDPTSERTSSFLGQSLRFARGNLFALFE